MTMSTGKVIKVTCDGCGSWQIQRVAVVLIIPVGGVLFLHWPCETCLAGSQRIAHPARKPAVLASGAAVRRPGEKGWPIPTLLGVAPSWPDARPRPASLSRLARIVGRRNRSRGN